MDVAALFRQAEQYTADGLRDYGYVSRNDLSCRETRDATVTSRQYFADRSYVGAVYDGRGALIQSTLRFNDGDIFPVDTAQIDDLSSLGAQPSPHARALYGGILFPILGHFFFESLARLWPLLWQAPGGAERLPVYFHHWPGLDLPVLLTNPLYLEAFRAFGLYPGDIKVIGAPERFDSLVVPDPASAYHRNLDQRMASMFDSIALSILGTRATPDTGRKLFLSRSRWIENRRILNEPEIDDLMRSRGFDVVHTETLAPLALITTLRAADTVVATDGSHAHLAAFCRSGIRTVMLDTRPVPTQFAISVLRGFRSTHVPLFHGPLYRMEQGITDVPRLGELIDQALA